VDLGDPGSGSSREADHCRLGPQASAISNYWCRDNKVHPSRCSYTRRGNSRVETLAESVP
jgi:hypothetical protein